MENLLFLIPLFPLLGAITNGTAGYFIQKRFGGTVNGIIATCTISLSFLISFYLFIHLITTNLENRAIILNLYNWISAGNLVVNFGLIMDPLSSVMVLIVSGVGSLIHIYSIGYMHTDKSQWRYFAYLNLFAFSMLILVMADNLLLMFVGWEGVGLCSYLLIGFWYQDTDKATAGMKAFITNRVGDFGFLSGLFFLVWGLKTLGAEDIPVSLSFQSLEEYSAGLSEIQFYGIALPTIVGLLFFVGATGKSAQIPLYVWLPDAMAGPTPVSALIHAATMVTAGVYMIARLNFIYVNSPTALTVIALVGALTALFAATMGFAQTDIKKILAYSTISQLGFMFAAVGSAAFSSGIFHLMTHAFFKACLFLGAGSVIHAMSGEQDIRKMGALKDKIPITFYTFFIASLAIAGVPGLSGFFSKDEILYRVFMSASGFAGFYGYTVFVLLLIAALCTAFYMFRLVFITFYGDRVRSDESVVHHIHESPRSMTYVLIILSILSIVGGYVGLPEIFGVHSKFDGFLAPVFERSLSRLNIPSSHSAEWIIMFLSVTVGVVGIYFAYRIYYRNGFEGAANIRERIGRIHYIVENKYFVDEVYGLLIIEPVRILSHLLSLFDKYVIDGIVNLCGKLTVIFANLDGLIDRYVVDGAVNITAESIKFAGEKLRGFQTGRIQDYIYIMVTGGFLGLILLRILNYLSNN
ncbi:MAG: NADH-quinone oxidoreductase subunit L [Deltaproteobacteria bacterium]|nr:NADH-quinone oxidoreductase subunit L [Deltaproteobacteria bacterium]